jgi:DNA repair protein RecO (recombination protein O)
LVLRVVHYGEADVILTLLTRALGKVSVMARGARKSTRRFAGVLEPMHTLTVRIDERSGADLLGLGEAKISRTRMHLANDLGRLDAAGQALRWVRDGSPARTAEPQVFDEIVTLLDRLDDAELGGSPESLLAATGLRLLRDFGYGLTLAECVRCGKRCDPKRGAWVDAGAGGLVCQACGGGAPTHHLIDAACRGRLAAASEGRDAALEPEDTLVARKLVDEALHAHAGVTR